MLKPTVNGIEKLKRKGKVTCLANAMPKPMPTVKLKLHLRLMEISWKTHLPTETVKRMVTLRQSRRRLGLVNARP